MFLACVWCNFQVHRHRLYCELLILTMKWSGCRDLGAQRQTSHAQKQPVALWLGRVQTPPTFSVLQVFCTLVHVQFPSVKTSLCGILAILDYHSCCSFKLIAGIQGKLQRNPTACCKPCLPCIAVFLWVPSIGSLYAAAVRPSSS